MTNSVDRRSVLLGILGGGSLLSACSTISADEDAYLIPDLAPKDPNNVIEAYWGDPDVAAETVEFNPSTIGSLSSAETKMAALEERLPGFEQSFLEVCQEFVGFNRTDNKEDITRFCNLFNLSYLDASGKPQYYCAMGLSYAAALTYFNKYKVGPEEPTLSSLKNLLVEIGQYHFYPTPSCRDMWLVAQGQRRWVNKSENKTPQPGWLVLFDWSGKQKHPNHVGVVRQAHMDTGKLATLEFNTSVYKGDQRNGGYVALKDRSLDNTVMGYIKTDFKNPFS
ncbi:MAG: CHAP domain-containing protein [Hyphomonas sp.]